MATQEKSLPATQKRKILLLDDHPIMREGFALLINHEPDLVVCCQAGTPARARELIAKHKPDLAIVDLALKSASGIECIKDLKILYPDLRMLVLSMHDEALYAERALRAGAMGYVMKEEAPPRVLEAIREVLRGGVYLSPAMRTRLVWRLVENEPLPQPLPLEQLSDRELEVFQLIGNGRATREIAKELNLSIKTIETYRAHIKEKFKLRSGLDLVRAAIEHAMSEGGRP